MIRLTLVVIKVTYAWLNLLYGFAGSSVVLIIFSAFFIVIRSQAKEIEHATSDKIIRTKVQGRMTWYASAAEITARIDRPTATTTTE